MQMSHAGVIYCYVQVLYTGVMVTGVIVTSMYYNCYILLCSGNLIYLEVL